MKKTISYDYTFSKNEIEDLLQKELERRLNAQDKDFNRAKFIQTDFTYDFGQNNPHIDVVIIMGNVKLTPVK